MFNKPAAVEAGHAEQPVVRLVGAAALVAGAVLHLVQVPGFALPVLYGLFVASAAGMLLGAVLLVLPAPRLGWLIGGGTALLTFLGYVLTRTTGLPGVLTSIGNWFYPLGVPSLIAEGVAFCLAFWALDDRQRLTPARAVAEVGAVFGGASSKRSAAGDRRH